MEIAPHDYLQEMILSHYHRRVVDQMLISRLSHSESYLTYTRLFDWMFEMPLYVKVGGKSLVTNPERRSDLCLSVNSGDGCCTGCPLVALPEPGKLEPWVWSSPCTAGLQVTMAPLACGDALHGWLVTGHHARGSLMADVEFARICRNSRIPLSDERLKLYHRVPVLSGSRYEDMRRFLELIGATFGAELNSALLLDDPKESEWARSLKKHLRSHPTLSHEAIDDGMEDRFRKETGLSTLEYLQRWKIEEARREIMVGQGTEPEILAAARRCGCPDYFHFHKLFVRFFSESPQRHARRMKEVELRLWAETRTDAGIGEIPRK